MKKDDTLVKSERQKTLSLSVVNETKIKLNNSVVEVLGQKTCYVHTQSAVSQW